ncbi:MULTISPECIES: alpha/beta hydrolase [Bacillus]|uniref:alpha/beta hydrolase n=1 Tax=Bacillus TaxID=1386 RepID=UPI0009435098|nr:MULTISPECIES: alpha/beta hydrolase [Bacillus cereus group]MDA1544876.1 alpha/beta hydrolase [Bacillus cereus group sp. TH253LC]MDA1578715.1 alpha/beta hydrolase [Bacillus cereus group sp. TH228LC]MDA1627231.1 alpha/beta hydrolase [Bacillus cereus group sp. TH172LC]MDA1832201.1 alpha/beta hydrolase [Bacillus cereus group sp. BY142LC]MEC3469310.1 alpha/beta hydrolase [Bacillus tropicus]
MKNSMTYIQLLNETLHCYASKGSLEAYTYIMEHAKGIAGNEAQIYNFKYALASAAGLEEEALHLMKEAIIEKGFWYGNEYLISDDDLKPLHKFEEFHQMVQLCKEREELAKKTERADVKYIDSKKKEKLFIAMHGDQENIGIIEPYWKSVLAQNYTLALPQSSKIQFSDGFVWDDLHIGKEELKEHYDKLIENRTVENVIIGGFSAGARVALYTILQKDIAVDGFIFMAPWLPEVEEWNELLGVLQDKHIKGYIVCGDQDEDCFECTQQFVQLLRDKNIEHKYKIIPNLNHDYPIHFEEVLKEAIEYIGNENNK